MTSPKYTWSKDFFEFELMIPLDYSYLYNVLLKNQEEKLNNYTLKKHLCMIQGLYPDEIRMIYDNIINLFTEGNFTYTNLHYIKKLCYNFLKYGVDAIVPEIRKVCLSCDKEYFFDEKSKRFVKQIVYEKSESEEIDEDEEENEREEACIEVFDQHIFTNIHLGIICCKCGKKSVGGIIGTGDKSIGNCILMNARHKWCYKRKLVCPYEFDSIP